MMELNITFDLSEFDADKVGVKMGQSDRRIDIKIITKDISELILECSKCGKNMDEGKGYFKYKKNHSLRIFIDRFIS